MGVSGNSIHRQARVGGAGRLTLYGEPRVWLERFPPGVPTPYNLDHLGLSYPGEVVRADNWSSQWGNPLQGEVYFRIVLLQQRRGSLRPAIQDPRIVVCLTAAGLSRRRSRLAGEVSTTRETQAVYLTQRDTETELIRQTLQRRLGIVGGTTIGRRFSPLLRGSGDHWDSTSARPGIRFRWSGAFRLVLPARRMAAGRSLSYFASGVS